MPTLTERRLTCCRCLHKSTDDDRVMLLHGGKGDEARCVDDNACLERQVDNIERARKSRPLVGIVR